MCLITPHSLKVSCSWSHITYIILLLLLYHYCYIIVCWYFLMGWCYHLCHPSILPKNELASEGITNMLYARGEYFTIKVIDMSSKKEQKGYFRVKSFERKNNRQSLGKLDKDMNKGKNPFEISSTLYRTYTPMVQKWSSKMLMKARIQHPSIECVLHHFNSLAPREFQ